MADIPEDIQAADDRLEDLDLDFDGAENELLLDSEYPTSAELPGGTGGR